MTPVAASQASLVQALPSSIVGGVPGKQVPAALQVSLPSQTSRVGAAGAGRLSYMSDADSRIASIRRTEITVVQLWRGADHAGARRIARTCAVADRGIGVAKRSGGFGRPCGNAVQTNVVRAGIAVRLRRTRGRRWTKREVVQQILLRLARSDVQGDTEGEVVVVAAQLRLDRLRPPERCRISYLLSRQSSTPRGAALRHNHGCRSAQRPTRC